LAGWKARLESPVEIGALGTALGERPFQKGFHGQGTEVNRTGDLEGLNFKGQLVRGSGNLGWEPRNIGRKISRPTRNQGKEFLGARRGSQLGWARKFPRGKFNQLAPKGTNQIFPPFQGAAGFWPHFGVKNPVFLEGWLENFPKKLLKLNWWERRVGPGYYRLGKPLWPKGGSVYCWGTANPLF